jgi:hypothetical protein
MIISQLQGGLGNQMFQYAFARRLAYERNVLMKMETSLFDVIPDRTYKLDHFNIQESFANTKDLALFRRRYKPLQWIARLGINQLRYTNVIEQNMFSFDPGVLRIPGHLLLKGYWQQEQYFAPITSILRKEFTFKQEPDAANKTMSEHIQTAQAISLHVRRGDYVNDPRITNAHGLTPITYYQQALEKITATVNNPHIFVFSDDVDWVRHNLAFDYPVTYVDFNQAEKDYEDLRLMSLCKHHVINNSSFSWWGAWLGNHPDQIVVAPSQWMRQPDIHASQVVPVHWHIIEV